MKICWDNLYKLRYNSNTGRWYEHKGFRNNGKNKYYVYEYAESCLCCKEPYLKVIQSKGPFCTQSCANTGKFNVAKRPEVRKKMSEVRKGKKLSEEIKKKMSISQKGRCSNDKHPQWKGGYHTKGIPMYNTYAHQIDWCEEIRRNKEDPNILEVKCTYCGKWYIPKLSEVKSRISAINGTINGELRLYCSRMCKYECPIYGQKLWPKGYRKSTSREVQPQLRQMVFERDDWTCQKCEKRGGYLHCHHITGVKLNPIESADIDNCITLCKECHKWVHSQKGCKYNDFWCK